MSNDTCITKFQHGLTQYIGHIGGGEASSKRARRARARKILKAAKRQRRVFALERASTHFSVIDHPLICLTINLFLIYQSFNKLNTSIFESSKILVL